MGLRLRKTPFLILLLIFILGVLLSHWGIKSLLIFLIPLIFNFFIKDIRVIFLSLWLIFSIFYVIIYPFLLPQPAGLESSGWREIKGWVLYPTDRKIVFLTFEVKIGGKWEKCFRRIGVKLKEAVDVKPGEYLLLKGIYLPSFSPSQRDFFLLIRKEDIKKLGRNKNPLFLYLTFTLKVKELMKSKLSLLPYPYSYIVQGLLLGGKEVPYKVRALFQERGVLHLFAVSGLHVGIVSAITYYLIRLFPFPPRVPFLVIMGMITFYLSLTGFSPSAIRAGIIVILFLLAKIKGKKGDFLNVLSFTALVMLIFNPFFIFKPGFQLTFLITFFLIHLTPWVEKRLAWLRVNSLRRILSVNLVANLVSWPLISYHFLYISPESLFWNLYLFPFLPVIMVGGILFVFLNILPSPISHFYSTFYSKFIELILSPLLNCKFTTFITPIYLSSAHVILLYFVFLLLPILGWRSLIFLATWKLFTFNFLPEPPLHLKFSRSYYLARINGEGNKNLIYLGIKKSSEREKLSFLKDILPWLKRYKLVLTPKNQPYLQKFLGDEICSKYGIKIDSSHFTICYLGDLKVHFYPSKIVLTKGKMKFTFSRRRKKKGYLNWRMRKGEIVDFYFNGESIMMRMGREKYFLNFNGTVLEYNK